MSSTKTSSAILVSLMCLLLKAHIKTILLGRKGPVAAPGGRSLLFSRSGGRPSFVLSDGLHRRRPRLQETLRPPCQMLHCLLKLLEFL
jgi:hypothetical protein